MDTGEMQAVQNLRGCLQISSAARCGRMLFAGLCLFVAIVSVFWNSMEGSWQYDDAANITNNPAIRLKELSWEGLSRAVLEGHIPAGASFRPVAYLSFALNFYHGGLNVFGYHLINLLIHSLTSLFLFLVIYRILNLPRFSGKYATLSYPAALLATLFWAIHPIQTQAVTYLVQRMALLAGLFCILSLHFYLRARIDERGSRKARCLAGAFISFLLALGSKENAIMLPSIVGLCEFLLLHEKGSRLLRLRDYYIPAALAATLLLGLVYVMVGDRYSLSAIFAGYNHRPFSMVQRLMTETRVLLLYVSLLLYPAPGRFSIAHDMEISRSLLTPMSTLGSTLFIFASVGALIWIARRQPIVSFSYLFFFLNHTLESTFLPLELIHEHRNYTPSMLFFIPPVIGLLRLMQWRRSLTYPVSLSFAFLLFSFGHSTYLRNFAWKSPIGLWSEAAKRAPHDSRVHHNLGLCLYERGNLEAAREAYEKALTLSNYQRDGSEAITLFNLGKLYCDLNRDSDAEYYYKMAVHVDPNHYPAYAGLAKLYENTGQDALAYECLQRGLQIKPNDHMLNFNSGLRHLRLGRMEEAIVHFDRALMTETSYKRSLLYLGIAYEQKGQLGRAAMYFLASAGSNPMDMTPHLHLLEIYQKRGLLIRAREQAEILVSRFMAQQDLFEQVIELILEKGSSGDVHLSAKVIFPVLFDVLVKNDKVLEKWKISLNEMIETQGANP